MIGKQINQALKEEHKFKWDAKKIKYLGINISKNLNELFEINYCVLENKIRQDLNRWRLIPEGLRSRIEVIKMMVLPRFLFLFQALPLSISQAYLRKLNKILSNFIWNNRKERIAFKILLQHKEAGGLNVPNLQNYFYAAQIQTIIQWKKCGEEVKWVSIEKEMAGISLGTLPFLYKGAWKSYTGQSFCITNTLKNWKHICKSFKINSECIYFREMMHDLDFIPNRTDNVLAYWANNTYVFSITNR